MYFPENNKILPSRLHRQQVSFLKRSKVLAINVAKRTHLLWKSAQLTGLGRSGRGESLHSMPSMYPYRMAGPASGVHPPSSV